MKILVAIPIYYREEISLNCIMSLLDTTVVPDGLSVTVSVGINVASDDLKNILRELEAKQGYKNVRIEITDFGQNLGKPTVVNKLSEGKDFDYLVSLDGDMICVQPRWLINMISVYQSYNRNPSISATTGGMPFNPKLGALCGNQFGRSCHAIDETKPFVKIKNVGSFTIVSTLGNGGIAGGILMTDYASWNSIGGYDSKTVYGGDDGYYCGQCHGKKKIVAYVKEIGFYHPYEINKQYQDWKIRAVAMINKNGPGLKPEEMKGFFQ